MQKNIYYQANVSLYNIYIYIYIYIPADQSCTIQTLFTVKPWAHWTNTIYEPPRVSLRKQYIPENKGITI